MEMEEINFLLETVNGVIVILLACAMVALVKYIFHTKRRLELTWYQVFFTPPLGIQLAFPMIAIKLGFIMTRGAIWDWRQFHGGVSMPADVKTFALVGTTITAIGVFWLIRVISTSNWFWIISWGMASAFIILNFWLYAD